MFCCSLQGIKWENGPGTVYTITWPVGTKLMLTLGANATQDVMEAEVRALRPRFRVCPSPQAGPSWAAATGDVVRVQYMRPLRCKTDVAGLDVIEYSIRNLEAY